ncbi:BRISC and BRCA1-A complex member 2-like [Phymastichus coffea]|uniref:BRISC and BRCA1-A complex member 2-like n=1 Tax=Phymastichus coffea TaxID=108790 RepID=UPI00273B5EF2|nr:BRISC and BRCA1-A complex member 2-like [Phymastichus coffea]
MSRRIYSSSFWMNSLMDHLFFSIKRFNLDSTSGLTKIKRNDLDYNCKFIIAYAGESITWEMNFDAQYPDLGPDLILRKEDFWHDEKMEELISNIPSLVKWHSLNDVLLYEIVNNLLYLLEKYEVKLLQVNSEKLFLEYTLMKNKSNLKNLEIYHIQGSKVQKLHISSKLSLNIPLLQHLENSKRIDILLFIDYQYFTAKISILKLYLPKCLENLFDETKLSIISSLNDSRHITEYIDRIESYISNEVAIISHDLENRKHFIANIITLQYFSVLEYDVTFFQHLRLLLSYSNLNFILVIQLTPYFLNKRVLLSLKSLHHMTNRGKPTQILLSDFCFHPNWNMKRMISEIFIFIINYVTEEFYGYKGNEQANKLANKQGMEQALTQTGRWREEEEDYISNGNAQL